MDMSTEKLSNQGFMKAISKVASTNNLQINQYILEDEKFDLHSFVGDLKGKVSPDLINEITNVATI